MSVSSFCREGARWGGLRPRVPVAILALLLCLDGSAKGLNASRPVSNYLRRSWSAEQNMSGATITGIAQTPDGYIWVGTSRGLLRFDGQTFTGIAPLDNEQPMHISSLMVDAAGGLWIWLESARLLRYQNGRFENMLTSSSADEVTAVARTPEGEILIATLESGILRYSDGKFSRLAHSPNAVVISLAQTSDGRIWAGTSENGLYFLDENGDRHPTPRLTTSKINCLLPIEDGRMWIGTDDGLVLWNGTEAVRPDVGAALRHAQILSVLKDRDSNLWIGSATGLYRLNGRHLSELPADPGEAATPVISLMEDREGELWFSDAHSLQSLRDSIFTSWSTAQGLPADSSGSIFVDPEDRLWLAPLSGGLYWFQDGAVHRVPQIGDDVVYSISGGRYSIWAGRQRGGVTAVDLSQGRLRATTMTRTQGLPDDSVYAVYEARDGTVWAATLPAGLSRLVNGRFQEVLPSDGQSAHSVSAIAQTADETMWFATANGLLSISGQGRRAFHMNDGLPSEDVICLAPASDGRIWIGTGQGLAVYSAGRIRAIGSGDPALRDPVFGLALDRSGILWIATSTHVLAARADALLSGSDRPAIRVWTEQDGLLSHQGVRRFRSAVLDRQGRVWMSLRKGISLASAATLDENSTDVPVQIEGMLADGQPVALSTLCRVSAVDRRLAFRFAGLSYAFPDRVLYEYRLDGFDSQWSEPTAMREAAYTNLHPRSYVFRVRAAYSGGLWTGPEAVLRFQIVPRFWETWEFDAGCVVAFGVLVFWGWRMRIRQLLNRANLRFEERLAERTRVAQDLHDTLLQGFISASMQLHVVADTMPPQSPAKGPLARIQQLMNQVIDDGRRSLRGLRTEASGHYSLEQAFIAELQNLGNPEQMTCRVIVQGAPLELRPVVRDEILSVGREALLNVFRHAAATRVEIEIRYSTREFQLIVRDDGRGMDHHILVNGRDGHWGLPGMRSHADAIGGKLKILSNPGAGTEVLLRIPGALAYENCRGRGLVAVSHAVRSFRLKRRNGQRART